MNVLFHHSASFIAASSSMRRSFVGSSSQSRHFDAAVVVLAHLVSSPPEQNLWKRRRFEWNSTAAAAPPITSSTPDHRCVLFLILFRSETMVEFKWKSLGDHGQETSLASAWYELLSVVHMMAMLFLLQANLLLIPKASSDESERMVSEDLKKDAVILLLKASGCLDYCVHHILVYLPLEIRNELPNDLQEGVLEAILTEALAQLMANGLNEYEDQQVILNIAREECAW